ncbi:uncharacterized protein LOC129754268 [Uranotaenia lowii]|uniref:uncharacterized protein LOC129754268 n=1 Tax=Uranotaenia lowii TaxID=190385 RepID=UPI0024792620|nr:uncharacterized protein LOC129754268 [Uranotaenia lowii]
MEKDTTRILASHKSLDELRLLNSRHEKLFKDFGIEFGNLSDAAQECLDDFAKIQVLTGLAEMGMSFVDDFCYQEEAKRLEARLQAISLKASIDRLKRDLKQEETDLARLERFVTETQAQLIPADEMEKMRNTRERQIEMLRSKQKTLMEKADAVNLDDLIAKVNQLQAEENA